jgi:hypothetical protein
MHISRFALRASLQALAFSWEKQDNAISTPTLARRFSSKCAGARPSDTSTSSTAPRERIRSSSLRPQSSRPPMPGMLNLGKSTIPQQVTQQQMHMIQSVPKSTYHWLQEG